MYNSASLSVTVILVSFNTKNLTIQTLRTILDQGVRQVVVVDNDSRDGSAGAISSLFPSVTLVQNTHNVGFAKAVNQALPFVRERYILLLNPDCELAPGVIEGLTSFLDASPEFAAAGPLVRSPRGRTLGAGFEPNVKRVFNHYFGLSRLSGRCPSLSGWQLLDGVNSSRPLQVDWLSGACLLVRSSVFREIGGFSERWFMYAEDLDLGRRLRSHGWRLAHLPTLEARHAIGASLPSASANVRTMWVDSLHDYFVECEHPNKFEDLSWRACVAVGLYFRGTVLLCYSSLRGDSGVVRERARRLRTAARHIWIS